MLAFAAVPGCDGSGSDPLTRAEFIAQADRICATQEFSVTTLDGKEIERPAGASPPSNRDYADDKQSILDDLEALEPPAADHDVIDTWLAARKQQIELLREGADAMESKDSARVRILTDQFGAARKREFATAKDYGMKVCSRLAGVPPSGSETSAPTSSANSSKARDFLNVLGGEPDRRGRIEVYRHKRTRALLETRGGQVCLAVIDRSGAYSLGCAPLAVVRRGEFGQTFGASSHGVNWIEEYHVIPNGPRSAVITTKDCRRRVLVRRNLVHAFIPTPAELTFRLKDRLVHVPFPDAGYPLPPEAERTEPFCMRRSSE